MEAFLEQLNKAQRDAVENFQGPSLVIAGAGSGKTRVLTYRIAYLLSKGVPAHKILALTFTNKAAAEMKDRIGKLIGFSAARNLWMGTFHSIFARILRTEAENLGFNSNFTIYDTADSKNLIKSIVRDLKLDEKTYKPGDVYGRISSAKNNLITPGAYASNEQIQQRDLDSKRPMVGRIYKLYTQRCKKANAMDFDDLLLYTNVLLRDHPDVLEKYQQAYNYILVDEYQDTNFSQYLIVNKLAQQHKNVCVVGDDAQSIYSFRGAKIENILNFRKDYPSYQLFKLEQNYRSTQNIVNAANSVIGINKNQIEKKVYSEKDDGEPVKVIKTETDTEEGFVVANTILDTSYQKHKKYSDFAILYRTNAQSRIFEEALRKRNIPYKVYGSLSFYQRKEIKDLIAYFRVIINSDDDEAFKRIINYPTRGIGQTTVGKITAAANEQVLSLWQVLENINGSQIAVNAGTMTKLVKFREMIVSFKEIFKTKPAYEAALQIANGSGILKELHNGKSPEEVSKYENIQELLNGIKEFSEMAIEEGNEDTLDKYMENVALLTDADKEKDGDNNKVSLMTIHAAKGLEFSHVFLTGLEEELFPSQMALSSVRELEEERRLFYVALTRAEEQVVITCANNRYKWGSPVRCNPSRFIKEIDERFLELPAEMLEAEEPADFQTRTNTVSRQRTFTNKTVVNNTGTSRFMKMKDAKRQAPMRKPVQQPADNDFTPDDPALIKEGLKVKHQRFGEGRVVKIEGDYPNSKASVFFTNLNEEKQLLLKFAKLKIVE